MIYRDFKGEKLSAMAMGCMRLPVVDGDDNVIDEPAAREMFDYAFENGVNYFDTAWGYHGGNSELVVGRALADRPRDAFYLADKFPGYDLANMGKVEEIFEEQLHKCQVEYFDFYLVHNVCELNIDAYLDDEQYGTVSYLREQVKNGRIRHLGFSCHGAPDVLQRFLDAYGDDMEFCQLQINYLDWTFQEGEKKVAMLAERGIPVWVMEPLRGGSLCRLTDAQAGMLAAVSPDEPQASWAFRFLLDIPEVTTILAGSSTLEQIKENIDIFSEERPLSDAERSALDAVVADMTKDDVVPCTACHYCTSHCPQELDIPHLLSLYNEHKLTGGGFIAPMALGALPEDKQPSACIGCGACEAVCPQQIKIPEALADFAAMLKE